MSKLNDYLDGRIDDLMKEAQRSSSQDRMWFQKCAQEIFWIKQVANEDYVDDCVIEEHRKRDQKLMENLNGI